MEDSKTVHKITHYLKNGEKLNAIEGHKVPVTEDTRLFYSIIANSLKSKEKTA